MEFTIDCRTCPEARSSACDDCVVTFITSRQPNDAVVIDAAEFGAIRRLMACLLYTSPSPRDS